MHYWNIQFFFQPVFYLETFGSLDVFQVDTSESGSDGFYCLNKFFGVFLIHFNVKNINTCIDFEK